MIEIGQMPEEARHLRLFPHQRLMFYSVEYLPYFLHRKVVSKTRSTLTNVRILPGVAYEKMGLTR